MSRTKAAREDFPSHAAYMLHLYEQQPRVDGVIAKIHANSARLEDGAYIQQRFCRYAKWEVREKVNYPTSYATVKAK
mgnify:FL=1